MPHSLRDCPQPNPGGSVGFARCVAKACPDRHRRTAKMLLAEVHALPEFGETALAWAREMHAYFVEHECPDWELAFAHTILAPAAHGAGETQAFLAAYANAGEAIRAIEDQTDREIVQKTFDHVPAP